MILILFETLIVKGVIGIGHWFAAHGTSAMAAKAGMLIMKSITVQGLATTLGTVTMTVAGVGLIVWSTEKLQHAENALEALYRGDNLTAAWHFANLVELLGIKVEFLPDAIEGLLDKLDFSNEDITNTVQAVRNLEGEILKYMTK